MSMEALLPHNIVLILMAFQSLRPIYGRPM